MPVMDLKSAQLDGTTAFANNTTAARQPCSAALSKELSYERLTERVKKDLELPDSPWQHSTTTSGPSIVSVFDFSQGSAAVCSSFNTAEELKDYFSRDPSSMSTSKTPLRRLIVMEGRDQRMTTVLGANLGMPPAVPLFHCFDPDSFKTDGQSATAQYLRMASVCVDQTSHDRGWRKYFRLGLPRMHATEAILDIPRLDVMYRERHFVTFWSKDEGKDSWTSVILSDPGSPGGSGSTRPRCINTAPLVWDDKGAAWEEVSTFPNDSPDSLYLLLHHYYSRLPHGATADPGSAMRYCIPAMFDMFSTEYIRSRKRTGKNSRVLPKKLAESDGPQGGWYAESDKISALQMINARNMNNLADCLTRLEIFAGNPYVSAHHVQDWRWLWDRFHAQFEHVQQLLEVYAGRASVEESIISNQQARHVGQLTTLATVLVPFTVTAGIFSMSGSFAAGETHFWVFWVVAIPVSSILLLNVLAGRHPELRERILLTRQFRKESRVSGVLAKDENVGKV